MVTGVARPVRACVRSRFDPFRGLPRDGLGPTSCTCTTWRSKTPGVYPRSGGGWARLVGPRHWRACATPPASVGGGSTRARVPAMAVAGGLGGSAKDWAVVGIAGGLCGGGPLPSMAWVVMVPGVAWDTAVERARGLPPMQLMCCNVAKTRTIVCSDTTRPTIVRLHAVG